MLFITQVYIHTKKNLEFKVSAKLTSKLMCINFYALDMQINSRLKMINFCILSLPALFNCIIVQISQLK